VENINVTWMISTTMCRLILKELVHYNHLGFPTDTGLCPLLTTHTHVKSNGDTHTYLECVESSWSEDALLDPPNPDEQFWREISRNEPAQ
jgi:hypothetical protein